MGRLNVPKQFVLGQPGVIETFAQIVSAGVRTEDDDEVISGQAARIAQGCGHGSAAGAADKNSFAPGEGPGRVKRLGVGDPNPIVDQLAVEGLGHKVLADALDFPRLRRAPGQYRAFRIGTNNADIRVTLLEVAGYAGNGAAGADTGHEGGHLAVRLLPDLRPGSAI